MDKNLVGRSCKIFINSNGHVLFFSVRRILSITDTHVSFLDKFDKVYCFRKMDITEVNEVV